MHTDIHTDVACCGQKQFQETNVPGLKRSCYSLKLLNEWPTCHKLALLATHE